MKKGFLSILGFCLVLSCVISAEGRRYRQGGDGAIVNLHLLPEKEEKVEGVPEAVKARKFTEKMLFGAPASSTQPKSSESPYEKVEPRPVAKEATTAPQEAPKAVQSSSSPSIPAPTPEAKKDGPPYWWSSFPVGRVKKADEAQGVITKEDEPAIAKEEKAPAKKRGFFASLFGKDRESKAPAAAEESTSEVVEKVEPAESVVVESSADGVEKEAPAKSGFWSRFLDQRDGASNEASESSAESPVAEVQGEVTPTVEAAVAMEAKEPKKQGFWSRLFAKRSPSTEPTESTESTTELASEASAPQEVEGKVVAMDGGAPEKKNFWSRLFGKRSPSADEVETTAQEEEPKEVAAQVGEAEAERVAMDDGEPAKKSLWSRLFAKRSSAPPSDEETVSEEPVVMADKADKAEEVVAVDEGGEDKKKSLWSRLFGKRDTKSEPREDNATEEVAEVANPEEVEGEVVAMDGGEPAKKNFWSRLFGKRSSSPEPSEAVDEAAPEVVSDEEVEAEVVAMDGGEPAKKNFWSRLFGKRGSSPQPSEAADETATEVVSDEEVEAEVVAMDDGEPAKKNFWSRLFGKRSSKTEDAEVAPASSDEIASEGDVVAMETSNPLTKSFWSSLFGKRNPSTDVSSEEMGDATDETVVKEETSEPTKASASEDEVVAMESGAPAKRNVWSRLFGERDSAEPTEQNDVVVEEEEAVVVEQSPEQESSMTPEAEVAEQESAEAPKGNLWSRLFGKGKDKGDKDTASAEVDEASEVESSTEDAVAADESKAPKRGFWSRLFGKGKAPQESAGAEPTSEAEGVVETASSDEKDAEVVAMDSGKSKKQSFWSRLFGKRSSSEEKSETSSGQEQSTEDAPEGEEAVAMGADQPKRTSFWSRLFGKRSLPAESSAPEASEVVTESGVSEDKESTMEGDKVVESPAPEKRSFWSKLFGPRSPKSKEASPVEEEEAVALKEEMEPKEETTLEQEAQDMEPVDETAVVETGDVDAAMEDAPEPEEMEASKEALAERDAWDLLFLKRNAPAEGGAIAAAGGGTAAQAGTSSAHGVYRGITMNSIIRNGVMKKEKEAKGQSMDLDLNIGNGLKIFSKKGGSKEGEVVELEGRFSVEPRERRSPLKAIRGDEVGVIAEVHGDEVGPFKKPGFYSLNNKTKGLLMPLGDGRHLSTDAHRLQVLMKNPALLSVDEKSSVRIQEVLNITEVLIDKGRVRLKLLDNAGLWTIRGRDMNLSLAPDSDVVVDMLGRFVTRIFVLDGEAQCLPKTGGEPVTVKKGEMLRIGLDDVVTSDFNSGTSDFLSKHLAFSEAELYGKKMIAAGAFSQRGKLQWPMDEKIYSGAVCSTCGYAFDRRQPSFRYCPHCQASLFEGEPEALPVKEVPQTNHPREKTSDFILAAWLQKPKGFN